MERRKLGNSDLRVSSLCLGTMTWGEQNDRQEAFAQMDYALARGINFFDTAELYPVPPKAETYGRTEEFMGDWFAERKNRDKVILASKVTGRSSMGWIRGGPRLNREHIRRAVAGSLGRLQTDYIDLYQLHWPERSANFFGQQDYVHKEDDTAMPILETLRALDELVKEGKVRHIGISNETAWGVMEYLKLAAEHDLPRVVSIQNPYNLLNRTFEVGLAEIAIRERCGLLAYSPLGFGVLSGKYEGGRKPQGARLTLFGQQFTRYTKPRPTAATAKYVALAKKYGLAPAAMSLAWVNSRRFLTSNIIGATTMEQLKEDIDSASLELSSELLGEIEEMHKENPNPAP